MGVKYSAADSAQLIQAMTGNLQAANQVTDRLSSGCDHLIASLESGELQGAAYTAGKGLFTDIIIPAIKKLQEAIDDIQGELASYKSADSEVAGYGELDLDLLKEQLKIKNEQLAKVEKQIADNQDFFRNAGALLTGKLGDLLSQTSALMEVETQLNIGIREIQEKIDKLEWFVDQVSQYFTDSLQVLGLAIQGATQLSQVLVDSEGNYSTDGIDMSWSTKMKVQEIQTVSKSDYRTPQEQAIDKAVKDMKLSGAAEIYYRSKLAEKLQGKPRSEWKKIISNFNKDLKTEKGDNLLDVFDMSRAELEEKYGDKIQAYEHFLNTGYTDVSIATMSQDALKLIMARYDQVKTDHLGLSPTELAKVDPAFKKKIDGMSQEEIEKEFPELKNAISQAHVKPFGSLGMSETEWANHRYVTDRYFLMDSQKLLSWRDPNYMAKFNHYILEEGINPITLEPATAEEIQTAEWYNRIHPITETLSWGTALYSAYVGYNQYYNKPYTTIPEAFGKGKDWIKGKISSVGSQPVVGPQLPSKNWTPELPSMNNIQSKYVDLYSYEYNSYTNPGPLSEFSTTPNRNFYGGRYNKTVLSEDTIFYRAGNADNPLGQWFTREAPQSRAQVRIDTAVKDIWTNPDGSYSGQSAIDKVYKIKIPKGTTIYDGPVGSQGGIYQGGLNKEQIFIDSPWNLDGVEVIDSWPIIH